MKAKRPRGFQETDLVSARGLLAVYTHFAAKLDDNKVTHALLGHTEGGRNKAGWSRKVLLRLWLARRPRLQ